MRSIALFSAGIDSWCELGPLSSVQGRFRKFSLQGCRGGRKGSKAGACVVGSSNGGPATGRRDPHKHHLGRDLIETGNIWGCGLANPVFSRVLPSWAAMKECSLTRKWVERDSCFDHLGSRATGGSSYTGSTRLGIPWCEAKAAAFESCWSRRSRTGRQSSRIRLEKIMQWFGGRRSLIGAHPLLISKSATWIAGAPRDGFRADC